MKPSLSPTAKVCFAHLAAGAGMRPAWHLRAIGVFCCIAAAVSLLHATAARAQDAGLAATVRVAPPTGEGGTDRASILAALEQVRPGGTVQFAPGTYLVGRMISVDTPHITLLGHPDGTTLRGCQLEDFRSADSRDVCNGLELAGERQTVRGLTFEHATWALHLGCCFDERAPQVLPDGSSEEGPLIRRTGGGHLVEGNTFRGAGTAVRVNGDWQDPAVVRGNRFLDNWHAVSINGHTVHLLDNHISAPEPEQVPYYGFAWDAIKISPPFGLQGVAGPPSCIGNIVAGNTIEGYVDGIRVETYLPGSVCRENVIRDNTIRVRRARNPTPEMFPSGDAADSTVIGVPIALLSEPPGIVGAGERTGSRIEDNLIEGNRIIGAEGIGIEILEASRNRIVNNTISRIVRREPFPGNTMVSSAQLPREANGSGIWVSVGSEENEIVGNTFEDIASHAVVLEGDRNRVETRSESDSVLDLGHGNRANVAAAASGAALEPVRERTAAFLAALSDDSQGFVAHFFADEATLALADGTTLRGRGDIVRDFLRPVTPRLRGVRPAMAGAVATGAYVEVTGTFLARFAPAPDTIEARFSTTWSRQAGDDEWYIIRARIELPDAPEGGPIRSRFFQVDHSRLHYLDFGGDGVPVVFMPVADRTAYSYIDYAARFSDRNRVLAITSRGTGESDGVMEDALGMVTAAHHVLALMDSLGIERAVVVPGWAAEIGVYLAEHHPHRLAGLVFPTGGPPPDLLALWEADPTGVLRMGARLALSMGGADPDAALAGLAQRRYVPDYIRTGGPIQVPALAFAAESGTPGVEEWWVRDVRTAEWVAGNPATAPDPLAREFYLRLATDEALQDRVRAVYRDIVAPAHPEAAARFRRAFGEHLHEVRLEVPVLSGYAYRDTPELIAPHVRRFLNELSARERRRPSSSTSR